MMGERQVDQSALFYEFSLERHVPADHLLRAIDRFVDLGDVRTRSGAVLQHDGPAFDRSRAADPDADRSAIASASARSGGCARRSI